MRFLTPAAALCLTLALLPGGGALRAQTADQTLPAVNMVTYGTGTGPWCSYAAQTEGYYAAARVRLGNVLSVIGDPNIVSALVSDQADIAIGSSGSIVPFANGQTDQLVIIASSEESPISLVALRPVTALVQLRGTTIALPQHNSSIELMATALLDATVGAGKWTPLYIGGALGGRLAALAAGKASAAFVNDPIDLTEAAGFHILTRFGARNRYFNGPVLSTRAWLQKNRETAIRFLAAFARGCNFILDPKNRATSIDLLAKNTPVPPSSATEAYDYYVAGTDRGKNPPRNAQIDVQGFANTVQLLKDAGIITNKSWDFRTAIDARYLDEALKRDGLR